MNHGASRFIPLSKKIKGAYYACSTQNTTTMGVQSMQLATNCAKQIGCFVA